MLDDMAQPEKFVEDLQAENAKLRERRAIISDDLSEMASDCGGLQIKLMKAEADNDKLRAANITLLEALSALRQWPDSFETTDIVDDLLEEAAKEASDE